MGYEFFSFLGLAMSSMAALALFATVKLGTSAPSPSGLAIVTEPHSEPSRAFPWPKPCVSKH